MSPRRVRRAATVPAPIRVQSSQTFDQAYGQWSTFTIGIGSPPQNFRVLPSTKISESWVTSNQGCISSDPQNCYQLRGGESFNGNPPAGFQPNASSTWNSIGIYGVETEQYLNLTGNGEFGTDVLSINGGNGSSQGGGVSLGNQLVATVPDKAFLLGYFGLGAQPSEFSSASNTRKPILQNLFEAKLIPSQSYGYTAGAYYVETSKQSYGSLTLGGYDASRMRTNQSISIPFSQTDAKQLMVGVQSITVSDSLNGTASMTAGTNGHMSLIDSSVSDIWLPRTVADNFASNFGLFYDNNTNYYILNETMRSRWSSANPSFTFKLGATALDQGSSINVVLPYKAFDFQLGWPVYGSAAYYFPIRRAANDSQYVIGRTLLQQAYIVVDQGRRNFTLAQAEFPNSGVSSQIVTITSGNTSSSSGSGGLSGGAIAGIVIGALAGLALILAAAFWWFRRRKTTAKSEKPIIAELEAKDDSSETKLHKVPQDGIVESGGDEVQELPDSGYAGYKIEPAVQPATNGAPQLFEMEGDSTLGSWPRSPDVSSPGVSSAGAISAYSPDRPSPSNLAPSPVSTTI